MAMDETNFVTQIHPYDITGIRDGGAQALILLASSLGWSVMTKRGQPAVITSRDGKQKRIPTDTSIRMSVFQTSLSTIMVHSGNMEPTIDLIDAIVKATKPSKDHERRLRLAVGESPTEHRQRLANVVPATEKRTPDEHLTQRVDVPDVVTVAAAQSLEDEVEVYLIDDDLVEDTSALREGLMVLPSGPFDGKEHGILVMREPTKAHYSGTRHGSYTYTSEVSLKRVWADGYVDYECVVCGIAGRSPRGIGAHRQKHTKVGEVEPIGALPYTRPGVEVQREARTPEPEVEFVDELPEETTSEKLAAVAVEVQHEYIGGPTSDSADILDQITKLVLPKVMADAEAVIAALSAERDEFKKRLAEVEGEFDALIDLLNSRKPQQARKEGQ